MQTGAGVLPLDAVAGVAAELTPGVHGEAVGARVAAVWDEVEHVAAHPCRNRCAQWEEARQTNRERRGDTSVFRDLNF